MRATGSVDRMVTGFIVPDDSHCHIRASICVDFVFADSYQEISVQFHFPYKVSFLL